MNLSGLETQSERSDMEERMIDVLKAALLIMQEAVFVCRQKKRELEEKSLRPMTKLTPTESQLRLEVANKAVYTILRNGKHRTKKASHQSRPVYYESLLAQQVLFKFGLGLAVE